MHSASDSSAVVGYGGTGASTWRAPPEAPTSGSVARNSMILLPVDGKIRQNKVADSFDKPSNVPVVVKQGEVDTQGSTAIVETQLAPENVSLVHTEHLQSQDTPTLTTRLTLEMIAIDDRVDGGHSGVVRGGDISGTQLAFTEPMEPSAVTGIDRARRSAEPERTVEAQDVLSVTEEISRSSTVTAGTECVQHSERTVVAKTEHAHGENMSTLTAGVTKEIAIVDTVKDENGVVLQDTDVPGTPLACNEQGKPVMLESGIDGVGQPSRARGTNMPPVEQEMAPSTAVLARTEVAHDGASNCELVNEQDGSKNKLAPALPAVGSYATESTRLTTVELRVDGTLDGTKQLMVTESAMNQVGGAISKVGISSCNPVKRTKHDGEEIASEDKRLHSMRTTNSCISEEEGTCKTNSQRDQDMFVPSATFAGGKQGYVFKRGDCGVGYYKDGYVDRPKRGSQTPTRRPWNAGPGDDAVRRGPIGPILKPFKNIPTLKNHTEKQGNAAEESDM